MSVAHGLIIEVLNTDVIGDYENYAPEPKLGNLKDEAKIKQKKEEAKAKFKDEAGEHPLLATVSVMALRVFSVEDPYSGLDFEYMATTKKMDNELWDFLETYATRIVCVFGPHPTTHMRLLQNTLIRQCGAGFDMGNVSRLFNPHLVERVNVWRDVCPADKDVDWQRSCDALGLSFDSPIDATHCILDYQGYIEYMRRKRLG